jgi:hypothetical protein
MLEFFNGMVFCLILFESRAIELDDGLQEVASILLLFLRQSAVVSDVALFLQLLHLLPLQVLLQE